ncbi:MAG: APC family permease [Clostridiales bacterium]|nr:APC family permease [Clostridiales bacterium]MDD7036071.1 APC family permease [Bacillota bacterium]MDY2920843.1 APC family permease [Lentihominibacter sp.]
MSEDKKKKIPVIGVAMMVCVTVAGGGFGIEDLVGGVGPGVTMLVFCVLPFIWSLPFGLSSAELSAAYPENGGMYVWAKNGLGEKCGFASGWAYTIAGFIEPATFAVLTTNYLQVMFELVGVKVTPIIFWLVCAVLIAIFAVINILGIKVISNMATVITVLCFIPFIVMVIVALMHIENPVSMVTPFKPDDISFLQAAGNGLLIGIWFNTGYETISTASGEIQHGEKVVPKGIILAIPIISIMYMLWVVPAVGRLNEIIPGSWADWGTHTGGITFVQAGEILGGAPLKWGFVAAGSLASMMILCEYIMAYAHVMSSFSRKGSFFKIFSKESKKYGTPAAAIVILSIVSIGLCLWAAYSQGEESPFQVFVEIATAIYAIPIILMFIANIKMRIKEPDKKLAYKVKMPNKLYIAYLCIPIIIYVYSVLSDIAVSGIGVALGLTAIPGYIFFKKIYRKGEYWKEMVAENERFEKELEAELEKELSE